MVSVGRKFRQGARLDDAVAFLHRQRRVAAEERLVAFGSNPAKSDIIHAPLVNVLGEFLLRFPQPIPCLQPSLETHPPFDQLLLSRLDRKVALGEGDGLLARITVLSDEIAGIAGQHEVLNFALSTLSNIDHFRDATKMIAFRVIRFLTGLDGALDRHNEVLPPGVTQRLLQFPREPEFDLLTGNIVCEDVELLLHALYGA